MDNFENLAAAVRVLYDESGGDPTNEISTSKLGKALQNLGIPRNTATQLYETLTDLGIAEMNGNSVSLRKDVALADWMRLTPEQQASSMATWGSTNNFGSTPAAEPTYTPPPPTQPSMPRVVVDTPDTPTAEFDPLATDETSIPEELITDTLPAVELDDAPQPAYEEPVATPDAYTYSTSQPAYEEPVATSDAYDDSTSLPAYEEPAATPDAYTYSPPQPAYEEPVATPDAYTYSPPPLAYEEPVATPDAYTYSPPQPAYEEPAATSDTYDYSTPQPAYEEPAAASDAYDDSTSQPAYEEPAAASDAYDDSPSQPAYEEPAAASDAYDDSTSQPAYEEPAAASDAYDDSPSQPAYEEPAAASDAYDATPAEITASQDDATPSDNYDATPAEQQWQPDDNHIETIVKSPALPAPPAPPTGSGGYGSKGGGYGKSHVLPDSQTTPADIELKGGRRVLSAPMNNDVESLDDILAEVTGQKPPAPTPQTQPAPSTQTAPSNQPKPALPAPPYDNSQPTSNDVPFGTSSRPKPPTISPAPTSSGGGSSYGNTPQPPRQEPPPPPSGSGGYGNPPSPTQDAPPSAHTGYGTGQPKPSAPPKPGYGTQGEPNKPSPIHQPDKPTPILGGYGGNTGQSQTKPTPVDGDRPKLPHETVHNRQQMGWGQKPAATSGTGQTLPPHVIELALLEAYDEEHLHALAIKTRNLRDSIRAKHGAQAAIRLELTVYHTFEGLEALHTRLDGFYQQAGFAVNDPLNTLNLRFKLQL